MIDVRDLARFCAVHHAGNGELWPHYVELAEKLQEACVMTRRERRSYALGRGGDAYHRVVALVNNLAVGSRITLTDLRRQLPGVEYRLLANAVSYLTRKGALARVGRGEYQV